MGLNSASRQCLMQSNSASQSLQSLFIWRCLPSHHMETETCRNNRLGPRFLMCVCVSACVHAHVYTCSCMHYMHACTHARTHTCTHSHTPTYSCMLLVSSQHSEISFTLFQSIGMGRYSLEFGVFIQSFPRSQGDIKSSGLQKEDSLCPRVRAW